MNLRRFDIKSESSILSWDEGLPLGNGKLGCLIYGENPLCLSLDRVDLWDSRPNPVTLEKGFNYENLIRLSKSDNEKDRVERARLFEKIYDEKPYPSKITAGRIELNFGNGEKNVRSRLCIGTGIAEIRGEKQRVQAFMHATRFVGMAKIEGNFTINLRVPAYISKTEGKGGLGYPLASIEKANDFTYYVQHTKTELSYGIFVLSVKKEKDAYLYFTVAKSEDGVNKDFVAEAKKELSAVAEIGYEMLKNEHCRWWNKYWKKSEISLCDDALEKCYYRSWYLFGSCSRKGFYPMPLQGVWTADNDKLPPWRGDYHHDTNTQLSYGAYPKADRMEEGETFIDYLWKLKPQFEKFAKDFYGVEGLLIPGVSTIDGKPMGGWAQYSLSPTMTIWAAQNFDEYYLYTGNEAFLKQRAYPFFKEIGEAFLCILREENGKLYLPLSTSPEIFDDTEKAYLLPNSNFDLALMRYLFKTLIGYCVILGEDKSGYETALSKLDEISVIGGYIALDKEHRLSESHRHFSHLMCLYPLHLINYDTKEHKKLYEAALKEEELLGTSMWVGFSFPMCAQIYAMAENGDGAYKKLRQFCDGFVAENGFHLNGDFKNKGYSSFHYRPFTLEASFGFCDALQETLLQDHQGYIHLFPALSEDEKRKSVSFRKFRSYGGVIVSAAAERGKLKSAEFTVKKRTQVRLKNTFDGAFETEYRKKAARYREENGIIILELQKGKTILRAAEKQ